MWTNYMLIEPANVAGNSADTGAEMEMDASFVLFKAARRVTLREKDMTVEKIAKIFQVTSQSLYPTGDNNVAVFPRVDGYFSSLDLRDKAHYGVHRAKAAPDVSGNVTALGPPPTPSSNSQFRFSSLSLTVFGVRGQTSGWWQLAYTYYLFLAFLYDSRKRKKGAPHHYDAFISYNVHDEDWVYREMLPVLEGEQGWRLCLHHRDFQPAAAPTPADDIPRAGPGGYREPRPDGGYIHAGKPIIDNITDAIYGSRKTICVITRRYLQSEWCSREIQMASFRLFDEQKDVLILLFLEEIPAHQLSPYHRMRKLVKRRTYLSWPQAGQHTGVFWQNVWRALEPGEAPIETNNLLTGC
ncbi:uncharacterized protein LOC126384272 [Epinephelus moara]|uniref:uncharacterized protein LOC126384272 n=1 Tax=Epinephelus moara TaxID=300413 RepID=UPI00214F3049|nr:uncharacterized protein LOC126384272 [Epinephelus moara]